MGKIVYRVIIGINMKKDKCSTKYCRGKVIVNHLGKLYCQECYEKYCEVIA